MTRIWLLGACLGALSMFAAPAGAAPDPLVCIGDGGFQPPPRAPAPRLLGQVLGFNMYAGATPPGLDPSRPMLAFVQGLHSTADSWFGETTYYGHNDMYDAAYARGYQTFFLESFGSLGTALTSIEHGYVLRTQLQALANVIGVERLNVIAHSKGGPDSNFAAIMGAPVDSIVTLSGAHQGSPLADLAQVDFLDFLAVLLGFNDAGTKFLQTGCMALMRPLLDTHPSNQDFSYFTTAGTGWGPLISELRLGGLYLWGACPGNGDNDGLVCVEHARHPLSKDAAGAITGEHRAVWDPSGDFELDHDNIRMGNAPVGFLLAEDCHVPVFDAIEPYVAGFQGTAARAAPTAAPDAAITAPAPPRPTTHILRGGPVAAGVTDESFPVEDGVRRMEIRVLVASADVGVSVLDPTGGLVAVGRPEPTSSPIFRGAYEASASITAPVPGPWTLRFESTRADAFAAVVGLDATLDLRLSTPATKLVPRGRPMPLELLGGGDDLRTVARVARTSTAGARQALAPRTLVGGGAHALTFEQPGVYSVALVSEGKTAAGMPFERTRVLSVGVVDPAASRAPPGLPAACQ